MTEAISTYSLLNVIESLTEQLRNCADMQEVNEALREDITELKTLLKNVQNENEKLIAEKAELRKQLTGNSDDGWFMENLVSTVRSFGPQKINAIREIRAKTGWELKASKDFVEMVSASTWQARPIKPAF